MSLDRQKPRTTIHAREEANGVVIRIDGPIDEHFDKVRFVASSTNKIVIVDMDAVQWITSFGIREWVEAIDAIPNTYLAFINVRPNVVQQFNMVSAFPGTGELVSLYAPYTCPHCKHSQEHLLDLLKLYPTVKAFELLPVVCNSCGRTTELDDQIENYLMYAAAAPPPNPPADYETVLNGRPRSRSPELRIDKRIEGSVTLLVLTGSLGERTSLKRALAGLEGTVAISMSGIQPLDETSVRALRPLWETTMGVLLVEATTGLIKMLPDDCWQGMRVLSLVADLHCARGHVLRGMLLQNDEIWRLVKGDSPPCCPVCNAALGADLVAEFATRGMFAHPPPEIADAVVRLIEHQPTREKAVEDVSPEQFGKYTILKLLGTGGMAEVYLAQRSGSGGFQKQLVVKRVHPHLAREPEFASMLLQEARLAARINHPNVVQIYDVGQVDDVHYIAMEHVDGWDLDCLVRYASRLGRPFPLHLALRICADIASGLEAAHSALDANGRLSPILHRDVSPHNVLVSRHGAVKLTDFGIAKALDSTSPRTPTGGIKGKLAYMAPEAVWANVSLDPRIDVFALGVILYLLVTLRDPFRRNSHFATIVALLHEPIPNLQQLRPEVPDELNAICARMLASNRDERYRSAHEVREALEAFLGRMNVSASSYALSEFLTQLEDTMLVEDTASQAR